MILHFNSEFRSALIPVLGSKDYRDYRDTLTEMDHILTASGLEQIFIENRIAVMGTMNSAAKNRHYKTMRMALRYSILLGVTGFSYRKLSSRTADSQLFQWFTHTAFIDAVCPVSKSSIERFEKMFTSEEIVALKFDNIFADTTCVKANIHFPVDWILLRDAARTLLL